MHIRSFHIDSFGFFRDLTLTDLPTNLAIFLGKNEAGKSTLLDFFRFTLMGYPQRKNSRTKSYINGNGQLGGSLSLDTIHGPLRLIRRPTGPPTLTDSYGNPLNISYWENLLNGITREVYTNIYGFSLAELQSFESLNTDGIRNALYGASFGTGLRSPSEVIKSLDNSMASLFKSKGSTQVMVEHLKEWEEICKHLEKAEQEARCYDNYALQLNTLKIKLCSLRNEVKEYEQKRFIVEKRLTIWPYWEQWRLIQLRIARLIPIAKTFPHDGTTRLERAIEKKEQALKELNLAKTRLTAVTTKLQNCNINTVLLHINKELRSLAERKSSYQTTLITIPSLQNTKKKIIEDLNQQIKILGPNWSIEKIHKIDHSLPIREQLERLSIKIQLAEEAHRIIHNTIIKIHKDLDIAQKEKDIAQKFYENFSNDILILDEPIRERLKSILVHLEELYLSLPIKKDQLKTSYEELHNILSQFHLSPQNNNHEIITNLLASQHTIINLVQLIQTKILEETEAKSIFEQSQQSEEQTKVHLIRLTNQIAELEHIDKTQLDTTRSKLYSLRSLLQLLSIEKIKIEEIKNHNQPLTETLIKRKPYLVTLGSLSSCIGCIILGLHYLKDITLRLYLPTPLSFLISLLPGYLFLFTGIGIASLGILPTYPQILTYLFKNAHLPSDYQKTLQTYTELQKQIDDLCIKLSIEYPSQELIEELEYQLQQKNETYIITKQIEQEIYTFKEELDLLQNKTFLTKEEYNQKNKDLVEAKKNLDNYFYSFNIHIPPTLEQITPFFICIETARNLWTTIHELEKDITNFESKLYQFTKVAENILSKFHSINWSSIPHVIDTVKIALELCKKADLIAEEKRQAAERVKIATVHKQNIFQLLQQNQQEQLIAKHELESAQLAWYNYLKKLGLNPTFSPSTVKKALECMDTITSLESHRLRIEEDLLQQQKEQDAFILPLQRLSKMLGCSPENDNWIELLDTLINEADNALLLDNEKKTLEIQKTDYENEVQQAQITFDNAIQLINCLLQQAAVNDYETFFQHASIKNEREQLYKKSDELEDILRVTAQELSPNNSQLNFKLFLQSFFEVEKKDLEKEYNEICLQLNTINGHIDKNYDEIRTLELHLKNLTSSESLTQLRLKQAAIMSSIKNTAKKWSRYALAKQLLLEAKSHFERERQPDIIRIASSIFTSITNGKWIGITSSFEDNMLKVLPPHGEPIEPEILSRGAQEQLYLALRLAHIYNHAIHASPLPVIMDDILVNFDPERAKYTIQAFVNLSNPSQHIPIGHQLLFFTCHPHIAEQLHMATPNSILYKIEDKTIFIAS